MQSEYVNNKLLILLPLLFLLFSCEEVMLEKDPDSSATSVFNVLWTNLDEKYSYFEYKKINWDSVYAVYAPRIHDELHAEELWNILSEMICSLNDGHVNLINGERWSSWRNCKPVHYNQNFDLGLIMGNYLKLPVKYAGSLLYGIIDSVGYVYYESFEMDISESDIDFLVDYFEHTKGLIIDIRNNGGGDSENADVFQSRLLQTKTLVEYIYFKHGPGHDDFTAPQEFHILPGGKKQYTKPIALLINRYSFSSSSFFASRMSVLPHVTLIGDTTGGGAGRPKYFDLPNGWAVRYSSTYALRADGFNFENGVPPDYPVLQRETDRLRKKDAILEFAFNFIRSRT